MISPNPIRTLASLRLLRSPVLVVGSLSIYDVTGAFVERVLVSRQADGAYAWPVEGLATGIYLLHVHDATGAVVASGRVAVIH